MKPNITRYALAAIGLGLTTPVLATNGDNLIGIGPISRALGGTGVAAPQDAISAVFSNPAAMCLSEMCSQPQADFALTLFMPQVSASVESPDTFGSTFSADGKDKVYPIPAIGMSFPVGMKGSPGRWRAGISAYGISGLGVDYRDTVIGKQEFAPGFPMVAGSYTDLAIMKFAPSIAYAASPDLSFGLSAHVDYATLDLNDGKKDDWGFGIQLGMVWKPANDISIGLTYISPQATTFDGVTDFDGDGSADSLKLEIPQQVAAGVAWTSKDDRLLVELNGRWVNWANAAGYDDFDWKDQWVVGIGVQYAAIPEKLYFRAGYNYGNNPVEEHNGWDGSFDFSGGANVPPTPNDTVNVQGSEVPRYFYESFRTIGFPAVVEHHLGLGVGYQFNPDLVLNLAYVHAFEGDLSGSGTDPFGGSTTFKSKLSEDTVDIGLTWRY